ncbi:MAG: ABC transporter ATP-binding protein [Vulcanimicrobiaceae bacterium]
MSGGALLEAHDLYRFFHIGDDETLALRGVSLALAPREMVAIMGPSGSGKSTLLACLAGLDEPDGGYVLIAGQRLTRRPEAERAALRARYLGVLLQSDNLIDHLTVADNVRLQLHLAGRRDGKRAGTLLRSVGIHARANARVDQLSGGEAVRAGLAVALAADPPVLLADEPTGEVDALTEATILDLIRAHVANGNAAVILTHSDAVAARADRVVRLRDGRIDG